MNTWLRITKIALALILAISWTVPLRAQAAGPWYVAPGGSDSNNCLSPATACASVGGAMVKAVADGTILVAAGTYTGTESYVVQIDNSINISGGWDSSFSTQNGYSTLDGQGVRKGLGMMGGDVTVDRFAIRNGTSKMEGYGAGISTFSGNLLITNCLVESNSGDRSAVVNNGGSTLTMTGCTIRQNFASESSSAIYNIGAMTINNSAIYANQGAIASILNISTLVVNNSTVSGNTSSGEGGGIYNQYELYLNNSTVSGNVSRSAGGGLYAYESSATFSLRNTIVTGNTAPEGADCYGTISSAGYNLIGDLTGCSYNSAGGDILNQDAHLGELIGPLAVPNYLPLLSGSPAIDAGNPSGCYDHLGNPLDTDQRGAARNGRCDIGAYEYLPPGPAASIYTHSGSPQHSPPLTAYAKPLQALVLDAAGSPVSGMSVTFSAPASGPSATFAAGGSKTTSVPTNASGLATTPALTANDQVGEFSVSAEANSLPAAQFSLGNLAWYVSTAGKDSNDCLSPAKSCATFGAALQKSGFLPGDSLFAASGKYVGSGEDVLVIDKDTQIYGGWDSTFSQQAGTSTLDGQTARRGMTVKPGVSAYIEGVTVENGSAYSSGGILNYGNLSLKKASILHNHGSLENYGSETAGGILNDIQATLKMEDCLIKENDADLWSYNNAGGILNSGVMTLTLTSIQNNSANSGGLINRGDLHLLQSSVIENSAYDAGGIRNEGTLDILNSSISKNISSDYTGGIENNGSLILTNSTVSSNTGGLYPYGRSGGISNFDGQVFINSSTIANNLGEYAGGIVFSPPIGSSGFISIRNSILAENQGSSGQDCNGVIESSGYNLVGDTAECTFQSSTGDLFGQDPRLFALIGSPGYQPLYPSSPAIDAGNPAGCKDQLGNLLASDQRGAARVGRCDIGAYEYNPAQDVLHYSLIPCIANNYCKTFFVDLFNDPNSGWPSGEDANHLVGYSDGEYRILVKTPFRWTAVSPEFKMAGGTLLVDLRKTTYYYGTYGLMFGISDDWSQFYSFEIDDEGNYGLFRFSETANSPWTLLYAGYSPDIHLENESNHLKLVYGGGSISAYANGTLLATISEGKYSGLRSVGLIVSSEANSNLDVRFDNFEAFPSECNFAGTAMQSLNPQRLVMDRASEERGKLK